MVDEKIQQLAETLLKSGIVHSKSQAIEMASNMSSTSEKVSQEYEDKRESITMPTKRNKSSPIDKSNPYVAANVEKMREQAIESKPIDIRADYEIPNASDDTPLNEAVTEEVEIPAEEEVEPLAAEEEVAAVEEIEEVAEEPTPIEVVEEERDNSDMVESQIDLGDVFNVNK